MTEAEAVAEIKAICAETARSLVESGYNHHRLMEMVPTMLATEELSPEEAPLFDILEAGEKRIQILLMQILPYALNEASLMLARHIYWASVLTNLRVEVEHAAES